MVLYQNTFKYGPGEEISPMLWGLGFHIEIKKEIFKSQARAFIFGMLHHVVALYQNTSDYGPVVKKGPMLLVLDFTYR